MTVNTANILQQDDQAQLRLRKKTNTPTEINLRKTGTKVYAKIEPKMVAQKKQEEFALEEDEKVEIEYANKVAKNDNLYNSDEDLAGSTSQIQPATEI